MSKTTLYRPVNSVELELIEKSDWRSFPPRLKFQPFFYPVSNIEYAKEINKWNIAKYGAGFILEFDIDSDYLDQFEVHNVGGAIHNEYWIPANRLKEFNSNIIGKIKIIK